MNNVVLSTRNIDDFISDLANEVVSKIQSLDLNEQPPAPEDPLNDFITKTQAKNLLKVSPTTLWRWEQSGKIKSYSLGGKRFYKRSELTEALTALKK